MQQHRLYELQKYDRFVIKGNKVNIQLNGNGNNNAKIKAIAEHPINEESEIYITVSNIEYNFFDDWAKEYKIIEKKSDTKKNVLCQNKMKNTEKIHAPEHVRIGGVPDAGT